MRTYARELVEHFDLVLTIAKMALDADPGRATHQLTRLRDALEDKEQAAKIGRLISRNDRRQSFAPMAIEEMKASVEAAHLRLPGEPLTASVLVPTDKETGAPLATVLMPDGHDAAPVLDERLARAMDDLLSEWQRAEELARLRTKPLTRCLIFGAPGVGKTRLARYLASRLHLPLVEARLDGMVSSYLGTTARNIGALFDFANRYRCVLFLDEFDAIAKARDDAQEVGEIKRVVNTLLQCMDRRAGRGFTLAATNHEHMLDPAVWRRFDIRIEIPKPGARTREQLLVQFARPLRLQDAEIKFLVWATDGMSGADIESLVDAGKRFIVLHGSGASDGKPTRDSATRRQTIFEALNQQALVNAKLFSPDRESLLGGSRDVLIEALLKAGFTQKEVGDLLGLSQSAVSRSKVRMPAGIRQD